MDSKPIVTCHGDQHLFSRLHTAVVQGLPRESVEWKRSYGRPRRIHIEANFVPFNPDILPDEEDWCLPGRPFLHTYWLDCDLDGYKAGFKEEIAEWLAALKTKNISDWLIIIVMNDDNKVKAKLLRTSVHDKVRSDFCSKQSERCIILTEGLKSEAKSAESWAGFFGRTRQLLLQSYNRNLGAFEEHMRAERERRTETNWNFCNYFLLQEELALMFEMLHLHEDALVQYDELDALFTQYVLNHVAGDSATWLETFICDQHNTWDGLSLAQPINVTKRTLIKKAKASLLDFRNYLFSRQSALTFLLGKPWEVAERSIPFMQNCIQELALLKVEMPPGSMAVWVFLSSLEILYTCDRNTPTTHRENLNRYAAGLWDFSRLKLYEIADVCDFLPSSSAKEGCKEIVEKLLEGASLRIQTWSSESTEEQTEPITKLIEALSSNESFQKHYLELSELAMGTYKFIGRSRSARKIGRDLASYYMRQGLWQKAEGFLQDALKTYKQDGWDMLAADTCLDIAECQRQLNNEHKLAKMCAFVAGSSYQPLDIRQSMYEEMMGLAKIFTEDPLCLRSEPAIWVTDVNPLTSSIVINEKCNVQITVHSKLPAPVTCDYIMVSAILDPNHDAISTQKDVKTSRRRHSSDTSFTGIDLYSLERQSVLGMARDLDLFSQFDMKVDNKTIGACRISHRETPLRVYPGPRVLKDKEVVKEDFEFTLQVKDVVLTPGDNNIEVTGTFKDRGFYTLSQACIKVQGLEFLKSLLLYESGFSLLCHEPELSVTPKMDPVLAGIRQTYSLALKTGSYGASEGSELCITTSECLSIECEGLKDGVILLPKCEPYEELVFDLAVCCQLVENGSFENVLHEEIEIELPSLGAVLQCDLPFHNPFHIRRALHRTGDRIFIQVVLCGTTDRRFMLCEPSLGITPESAEVVLLNKPGQQLSVTQKQSASYIWQLQGDVPEPVLLDCALHLDYSLSDTDGTVQNLGTKFTLQF